MSRTVRVGSRAFHEAFDAHLVDEYQGGGMADEIANAISGSTTRRGNRMHVQTNPYQGAMVYRDGGCALVYYGDIVQLWEAIGLGVSYTSGRLSDDRVWDIYGRQIADAFRRHGYTKAARDKQADYDARAEWCAVKDDATHSDDRVTYHGGGDPVNLCGFHAQKLHGYR